ALASPGKPAAKAARAVPAGAAAPAPVPRAARRARAYLQKMDSAVQGQGGDVQTYRAACVLVHQFGLSVEDALPLLRERNETHCAPPWEEAGLRHKLERARLGPRPDRALLAERPAEGAQPTKARQGPDPGLTVTSYCGVVRDLGMVDNEVA